MTGIKNVKNVYYIYGRRRVKSLWVSDHIDVTADRHEESIVNKQVSDVNYQESLWVILGQLGHVQRWRN